MPGLEQLIDALSSALHVVKAYDLPAVASAFGLEVGDSSEAFSSKRSYVRRRIAGWSKEKLVELAKKVQASYPTDSLQCAIETFDSVQPFPISELTRQHLFSDVLSRGRLEGKLHLIEFLERLWPIKQMFIPGDIDFRYSTAHDVICQHMISNDDWSYADAFKLLGWDQMSNAKLVEFLEWTVNPLVRVDEEQQAYVTAINARLKHDGFALIASDQVSGYPLYRIQKAQPGVSGTAKNLIFASTGPKPEIIFADAINNDIRIVNNEEFCLVYDLPLSKDGLRWGHLVEWWAKLNSAEVSIESERQLYARLRQSLASPPELVLFKAYFQEFHLLGNRLPALIPQVYLHYDPYTLPQLRGERRLERQRMDFLILFSHYERVVIEVDGSQHYSDDAGPSPGKYATMVRADRDLRLAGYEVYRFGGAELTQSDGQAVAIRFFERLFEKHGFKAAAPDNAGL